MVLFYFIIIFLLISLIILITDKILIFNNFINLDNENLIIIKSFMKENSLVLNKLYNFPINLITILLMIYLFLTLIAVVKITNVFEGPLRPKSAQ